MGETFPDLISRVDESGNKIVELGNISETTSNKIAELQNIADNKLLQDNIFNNAVEEAAQRYE